MFIVDKGNIDIVSLFLKKKKIEVALFLFLFFLSKLYQFW